MTLWMKCMSRECFGKQVMAMVMVHALYLSIHMPFWKPGCPGRWYGPGISFWCLITLIIRGNKDQLKQKRN